MTKIKQRQKSDGSRGHTPLPEQNANNQQRNTNVAENEPQIALRRFGLGPRPGDASIAAADPRGYVLAGLDDTRAALLVSPDLQPSHEVFAEAQTAQRLAKLAKADAANAANPAKNASPPAEMTGESMAKPSMQKPPDAAASSAAPQSKIPGGAPIRREALAEELAARIGRAVTTGHPFVERLVMFWSNHFCVSAAKGAVRGLAGGYEREAIRPHVLGRFADMLRAVEQHPAMLIYLDNQTSTGPNSKAGQNRAKGLNENLAREILELHTVGVGGGYAQDDVTNFARILTGWTVGSVDNDRTDPGKFYFAPARHEPGSWTVLGKSYRDEGQRSGEAVLDALARHPSTARHIASKLARHFVAENPPPALVAALEKTFLDTGGDLEAVARTLAAHPACWTAPPAKIVPPYDFIVALLRGLNMQMKTAEAVRLVNVLGQPAWQPPSPKGWPDDDNAWLAPSEIRERLRIAERVVRDVDKLVDPRAVAADLFGAALGDHTKTAIARADSREQGLVLLAMSPEFLRR